MSNTLVTIDMIASRFLAVAHEKAAFISTINRNYDEEFGKKGGQVGDTIRIRNPNQYVRRQGSRVMQAKDQQESTQSLAVSIQDGVDMQVNGAELATSIDKLTPKYIVPAADALISGIEADVLGAMTKATFNVVGTAGTVPGASGDITVFGNARARLNKGLAPKDSNRRVQLDSVVMASVVNAVKTLFTPAAQLDDAFSEGFITRNAMADWYENDRALTLANGTVGGSTNAAAAVTDGGVNITNDGTATVTIGAVFTVSGVFACHPETKQVYNYLQPFTITAAPGSNQMTVSPATYLGLSDTTAAKKNVVKSDGTALALTDFNSKALTFVGSSSTSYNYGLMYHRDAFAFASADLPIMDDSIRCVSNNYDGLAVRVWQASDIVNDRMLIRLDMLYGYLAQRAAWASRIICN